VVEDDSRPTIVGNIVVWDGHQGVDAQPFGAIRNVELPVIDSRLQFLLERDCAARILSLAQALDAQGMFEL
jgi:hypothetical protein